MTEQLKEQIRAYIRDQYWDEEKLRDDSDIFQTLGAEGDDCDEFLEGFADIFNVNLDGYVWYFHHQGEGFWPSIGSMIIPPPYKQVQRIPITIDLLTEFALQKSWTIDYPEHDLPNYRVSTFINVAAFIILIGAAGIGLLVLK